MQGSSVLQLLANAPKHSDLNVSLGIFSIALELWSPGGDAITHRYDIAGGARSCPASPRRPVTPRSHAASAANDIRRNRSPPCALLYLHAFLRSSQVTCLAAPALLFVDVQWEFELPLCGAAIALPFALSLSAFAVSGDITAPFNASTPTLLARAHHAAM